MWFPNDIVCFCGEIGRISVLFSCALSEVMYSDLLKSFSLYFVAKMMLLLYLMRKNLGIGLLLKNLQSSRNQLSFV